MRKDCPNCKGKLFLHQVEVYLGCPRCGWSNKPNVKFNEKDFITYSK